MSTPTATAAASGGLARVPLEALRFHPRNIRKSLGDLRELAESIRREGVLVPLMAQRTPGGGLQLLHGHRRWAACDMIGRKTAPVVIIERVLSDDQAILLMLAEDKKEAVDAVSDAMEAVADRDWDFLAALAFQAPLDPMVLSGLPDDVQAQIGRSVSDRLVERGYRHGGDWAP